MRGENDTTGPSSNMTAITSRRSHEVSVTPSPPVGGGVVTAAVLALPERCYRCGVVTRSIVGVLIPNDLTEDPDGFVGFEFIASAIATRVSAADLARWGVGTIKIRRSRHRPEGYPSNGCIGCDAIQGSFPLHENLMEFLSEGGRYDDLIVGWWSVYAAELAVQHGSCGL